MNNFDSDKHVVVKIILEDNKEYFIEDYEDISCSHKPNFIVLNSINKDKFIKSLKQVIHIPRECNYL